jgi:hypothetical protein
MASLQRLAVQGALSSSLRLAMHILKRPLIYAVNLSSSVKKNIACSRDAPHISIDGCKPPHTAGRSGRPKMRQPSRSSSCTQRTPAGLPFGMPGIGELIEGAVQQAPQPGRQWMGVCGELMGRQGNSAVKIVVKWR